MSGDQYVRKHFDLRELRYAQEGGCEQKIK